jgi:antitoxin (DNA-binding transcriptional repressor) of toxin-antitoxin stability system
MNATIVDLRYRMRDVLRAIERGETVTILYRGKAKAMLMPIAPASKAAIGGVPKTKDQPLFGLWSDRDHLADPASYVRNLRKPRKAIPQSTAKKPT